MRNSMKIANWEVKRNLKNKSFLIGLFITPVIFLFFMIVPSLFGDSDEDSAEVTVLVKDELNVFDQLQEQATQETFSDWDIQQTDDTDEAIQEQLNEAENTAYISITVEAFDSGVIPVYTSENMIDYFEGQLQAFIEPLRVLQLQNLDLTEEQLATIEQGLQLQFENVEGSESEGGFSIGFSTDDESDVLERVVPGIFAGVILFSIVISGMMIFQSASQEKKDKIAEIVLSSVTPNELMQGKIIGYFILGIVQVFIWLVMIVPVLIWRTGLPILDYIFVPELAILLLIALLGYLVFASLFVGVGATVEDASTSGNFQGMLFMLPFIPFFFIAPIISNPSGVVAQILSYIPFTSPAILLVRLTMLEEWPWVEIIIAIVILIFSAWLLMKLAGKIFKTGILLYGKNATPKEIWKWLWM